MIPDNDHLYLDATSLYERGWTETLIKRFLGRPDRRKTVEHWLNYQGKRCYFLGRIETMEADPTWVEAFNRSVRKRKLTPKVVNGMILTRKNTQGQVKQFVDSLTDEDVRFLKAVGKVAEIMQDGINHGLRTPNK